MHETLSFDIVQTEECYMCRDLPINPHPVCYEGIVRVYICNSKNDIDPTTGNLVYRRVYIQLASCYDHKDRLKHLCNTPRCKKDITIAQLERWDWTFEY